MECKLDECIIKKNFKCCHGCDKEYSCERRCSWYSEEDCEHLVAQAKVNMKVYIIMENCDGRIYEIYLKKTTAEKVLESLNKHGVSDYFIREYEVEEV